MSKVNAYKCCGRCEEERICNRITKEIFVSILQEVTKKIKIAENECMVLFNVVAHTAIRRCQDSECFPGTYMSTADGLETHLLEKFSRNIEYLNFDCPSMDRGLIAFPLFDMSGTRCYVYVSVVNASEYMQKILYTNENNQSESFNDGLNYLLNLRQALSVLGLPFSLKYREQKFEDMLIEESTDTIAHDLTRSTQALLSVIQSKKTENGYNLSEAEISALRWFGICVYSLVQKKAVYNSSYDIAMGLNSHGTRKRIDEIEEIINTIIRVASEAASLVASFNRAQLSGSIYKTANAFIVDMMTTISIEYGDIDKKSKIWKNETVQRSLGQALLLSAFFSQIRHLLINLIKPERINYFGKKGRIQLLVFKKFFGIISVADHNRDISAVSVDNPLSFILRKPAYDWNVENTPSAIRYQLDGSEHQYNFQNDDDKIIDKYLVIYKNDMAKYLSLCENDSAVWYVHIPLPDNFWND